VVLQPHVCDGDNIDGWLAWPSGSFGRRARYRLGVPNAPGCSTPHEQHNNVYAKCDTTPPIWIQFKKQLNFWYHVKLEIIFRTAKSQKCLVLSTIRLLEGTKGDPSRKGPRIVPSTHNKRQSLYSTSKGLLSGVCHLRGQ
jgi:hypothetical protein